MNKKVEEIIKRNKYRSDFYKKVKRGKSTSLPKSKKDKEEHKKSNSTDTQLFNFNTFMNRVLIATMILMMGLIIKKDDQFNGINQMVYSNMNLKQIDQYVITNFGRFFPLPKNDDLYVSLPMIDIYNSRDYKNGVLVTTSLYEGVQSQTEGLVIKIYEDDDVGQVIVIQNSDGMLYEYGALEDVQVSLYSRVDYGEIIGMAKTKQDLSSSEYYLAIKDEGEYLNVFDVVGS